MAHPDIQTWKPGIITCTDELIISPAHRMAAMLDQRSEHLITGAVLPELWHWLYFLPADSQCALSADGHAVKGHFLPPVNLPRRMWASSNITWHDVFHFGEHIERISQVRQVQEKSGSRGRLVFVDVEHRYRSIEREIMTELHTIVYREASAGQHVSPPAKASPAPQTQFSRVVVPDPRLLFRYSALTFNTHRIHYDLDYVLHEEGYPGLVVHGPLTATLLVDLLTRFHPGVTLSGLQFRAISPLFSPDPVRLNGRIDGNIATLWATGADNQMAMKATALMK